MVQGHSYFELYFELPRERPGYDPPRAAAK